ncbi:MAG: hypothetical protein JST38_22205 [Bacteroidetes bacterium]|nr:hypothetical protein [Bacteroidota bacterium]
MSALMPTNLFKFATVRAPRKPTVADTALHTVPYTLESTLHQTLATQRPLWRERPRSCPL